MECASLVLPILYDINNNVTQLAEKRDLQSSLVLATVSNHLKKFAEFNQQQTECTLFPAIRDLLMSLVLPTDPPMPEQQQQPQQMMGQNPMMNSPMGGGNVQMGQMGGPGGVGVVNVMNPNMGNF